MTDHSLVLAAPFRRPPEDGYSTTVTAGWCDAAFGEVPGRGPGEIAMTRQGASDIVVRATLSPAEQQRVLALPYPVEYQAFWRVLAGLGVTREFLMDRLGASP
jgi:hypothetical protein